MSAAERGAGPGAGASTVAASIDLDRDGAQLGTLRVPHSRDSSAWGSILVPIGVVKRGDGPTVLCTAGAHGDEYEGPIALAGLLRALLPEAVRGRVIVLPALNLPAVRAGTRLSPVDGRNLNRAFPGARDGGPTERIAHYVATELVPRADVVLDLHSGGRSLDFLPCAVAHRLPDPGRMVATLELLRAFGAPVGLVLEELDDVGMLDTLCEESGRLFLSTELGGAGAVTARTVAHARRGVLGVLRHAGVLTDAAALDFDTERAPATETKLLQVPGDGGYALAGADGVFEPALELGEPVEAGQAVGRLHIPWEPSRPPEPIRAGASGVLLARRALARTEAGDCLAVIAGPYRP